MGYIGKPQSADPIEVNSSNITDGTIQTADISSSFAESISGSFNASSASFSTRVTTAESELSNTLVSSSVQIAADISGSFGNQRVGTTNNVVFNNITASGNISSSTIESTGDMTLNSAGDVIIDADGADVILKDDGTEFGRFKRDSSDFVIKSATNNKDIIFKGQDGGATITALTLDMSESGDATFNNNVTVQGTLTAQEIHTEFTSASIMFESGSTIFGDTTDDIHQMTGSVRLHTSGSAIPLRVEFEDDTSSDTSPEHLILQQNHAVNNNKIGISFNFEESDGGGAPQVAGIYAQLTQAASALSSMGSELVFFTNTIGSTSMTEALRIDENGKVGIGTNNPSERLHIYGTQMLLERNGNSPKLTWKNSSSDSYVFIEADHDDLKLGFYDDGEMSETTRLFVSTSGNVGIGETSPDGKLHVKQSTDNGNAIVVDSGTDGGRIDVLTVQESGNERWNLSFEGSGATNDLTLNSNSTNNILNIKPGGNVGIGTTNPLADLHVSGSNGKILMSDHGQVTLEMQTNDTAAIFQRDLGSTATSGISSAIFMQGKDTANELLFHVNYGGGDSGNNYNRRLRITQTSASFENCTVGIGTTAPNADRLSLYQVGSTTAGARTFEVGYPVEASAGINGEQYMQTILNTSNSSASNGLAIGVKHDDAHALIIGQHDTTFTSFVVNGDGKVGIGTTTPSTATNILFSVGSTGLGYSGMEFIAGTNAESWRLYTSYNGDSEAIWGLYRVADSSYKYIVHENGKMGIGNSDPEGWLTINQGTNDDKILSLKTTGDLAHGVTDYGETDTFGYMKKFSNTQGGLMIGGMSTHERPIVLQAFGNYYQSAGAGTGTDKCAVQIFAYENSGTGITNVGANESIFAVRGQKGGSMQSVFIVDIEGDLHTDGSTSLAGYDYAEYFEWTDGNPDNEDRVGYSVVLEGDKIRKATEGETPIGIISGVPAVVGDNPMGWQGTWKTDEWGRKINKEVEFVRWEYDYQSEEGAEVVKQEQNWKVSDLPEDLEIPDNAKYYTKLESQYSDDYDPSKSYTLREYRQEWSAVGLMGKLRLRKGQPVASTWIKMRDEGNNIEMWLVK